MKSNEKFIKAEGRTIHYVWDNCLEPIAYVSPGDELTIECLEASGGQLSLQSRDEHLLELDFDRINPVTGPLYLEGASPGDVLEVEILKLEPKGWGWTGIIPGFGLLAEDFPEPALKVWDLGPGDRAVFKSGIEIPCAPFPGTIGVALDEAGSHVMVPPRRNGGNMDNRGLTQGTKLYLPVWVEGALFSVGDPHVAQGEGEVCGTAIEAPMNITVRFGLHKDFSLEQPQFQAGHSPASALCGAGYYAAMGIADDLMEATKGATRYMIQHLQRRGLSREEAYMLCSIAGELRISQVVDHPNWTVTMYMPQGIFRR